MTASIAIRNPGSVLAATTLASAIANSQFAAVPRGEKTVQLTARGVGGGDPAGAYAVSAKIYGSLDGVGWGPLYTITLPATSGGSSELQRVVDGTSKHLMVIESVSGDVSGLHYTVAEG
ncbi:hypothetical protein ACTSKR_07765 [Chitinibacteraceae bacterium HSL-7]